MGNIPPGPHSPLDNLKFSIGLVLCLFIYYFMYLIQYDLKLLYPIINYTIILHSIFVFLQILTYYFLSITFNPLEILLDTGIYKHNILSDKILNDEMYLIQRSIGGAYLTYRPAGLFTEPGAYAITMILLLSFEIIANQAQKRNSVNICSLLIIRSDNTINDLFLLDLFSILNVNKIIKIIPSIPKDSNNIDKKLPFPWINPCPKINDCKLFVS